MAQIDLYGNEVVEVKDHGDAEYCPECVKTWKDRNGREIPSSESGSYWRIKALSRIF